MLGALALAAWVYLVFGHGRFWLADQRLGGDLPSPVEWPEVGIVVPARNESDVLDASLRSLLDQDYPGDFRIVLVDDESADGTAETARQVARSHVRGERLQVEGAAERPSGWVGKVWALECGLRRAREVSPRATFWLLTDADVVHGPGNLRRLVAKACADRLELVSLMVRLRSDTRLEGLLVPAFVYFFQKLYPFPRVNDPASRVAAAAGGCALVARQALERAGGIQVLRGEIIDDCALAAALKPQGAIWLGLSGGEERSVRGYGGVSGVWGMVARSAFTQLRYSGWLLAGTLLGLGVLYAAPPWLLVAGSPVAAILGATAWLLMAASFVPTLVLYGRSPLWGFALPLAGIFYACMTLDSARRHVFAQGAEWKGRPGAGSPRAAQLGRSAP